MSLLQPAPPGVRLELVVACSNNDVIGRGNALPWHLPDDLRRFKSLTLGKPILMGRKTYDSIGKALPGRLNLVLSRQPGFTLPDARWVADVPAALAAAAAPVLMVIGGSQVYAQTLAFAQRIHLTLVDVHVGDGDAFFPGWRDPAFIEVQRETHPADARHAHAFAFITLERAAGAS